MSRSELTLEICCPRRGGPARFEEPFEFIGGPTPKANSPLWQLPRHGPWFIRARFPSLLPWKGSDDHWQHISRAPDYWQRGVSQCLRCQDARVCKMRWPHDAFWRWEIRGGVLWAYSHKYAQVRREFIGRSYRAPEDFGMEFAGFLVKVPSEFLRAQVRDEIVRKIDESLVISPLV